MARDDLVRCIPILFHPILYPATDPLPTSGVSKKVDIIGRHRLPEVLLVIEVGR